MPGNWDQSVFDKTLKQYLQLNTSRTFPEILNSKAYFIARASTWFTAKADKLRIQTGLGQIVTVNRLNKKGKTVRKRELILVKAENNAPLAALIINARRRAAGQPGLKGGEMERAIRKLIGARTRSVAFLKSGWLPAIRTLAPLADRRGAPAQDPAARIIGQPKGTAIPARGGLQIKSTIVNLAFGNRADSESKARAMRVAERGLQRAFDNEVASMNQYFERKMKPDADKFNAQQH